MSVWKAPNEVESFVSRIRGAHHPELQEAKIAVLLSDVTPVVGNRLVLGKMKKTSEEDRTLHGYDFKLILSAEIWEDLSEKERCALIDHELTHGTVERVPAYEISASGKRTKCRDEHGRVIYTDEVKIDEATGRPKFKVKPHDVETFLEVIERHGLDNCPEIADIRRMRQIITHQPNQQQQNSEE